MFCIIRADNIAIRKMNFDGMKLDGWQSFLTKSHAYLCKFINNGCPQKFPA